MFKFGVQSYGHKSGHRAPNKKEKYLYILTSYYCISKGKSFVNSPFKKKDMMISHLGSVNPLCQILTFVEGTSHRPRAEIVQ